MSWVVWRQYRAAAAITAALIAAFAALVVVTGVQAASQWHSALSVCTASRTCGNLSSSTLFLGSHAIGFLVIMTLGVPAVLGILAGAPLLAHEFETGTNQYAWTQSVTRRRWLAVKAGWLLLAAAAIGGIVSALVTWWSGPNNALQANAFDPGRFDIMGIVPVGYAVFATALGITGWRPAAPDAAGDRRHAGRVHRRQGRDLHGAAPVFHDRGDQLLPDWQRVQPRLAPPGSSARGSSRRTASRSSSRCPRTGR